MTAMINELTNDLERTDVAGAGGNLFVIAERLNRAASDTHPSARLALLRAALPGRIIFTTSFGIEDQAITHMIADAALDIDLATLDTGRMFAETYDLWSRTEARFGRKIASYHPRQDALEALIKNQGINGFFNSVAERQACCAVRKVEPLNRALAGAAGWITGLRADQSNQRRDTGFVSIDRERGILKASPLFDWSRDDVVAFTSANRVPVNPLHARGFLSIGCQPCTRAVEPGEPERAGRWWWENDEKKECGLHPGSVRPAVAGAQS